MSARERLEALAREIRERWDEAESLSDQITSATGEMLPTVEELVWHEEEEKVAAPAVTPPWRKG